MKAGAWLARGAGSASFLSAVVNRRLDLKGCHALITGGSRGLGLALARELVRAGARVGLLARDEQQLINARRTIRESMAVEVDLAVCDLRYFEQIKLVIPLLIERWGKLDILINNAGIIQLGRLEHTDLAELENAMAVHFWAPLHTMRAVLPTMRQQGGGRIVNISSIEGKMAFPHMAPYCASKFALTGLSDAWRSELAREHIYVTTVSPGLIRTGAHEPDHKGTHARDQAWLSLATAAPLLSMSAERAARRIVKACAHGERSLELGLFTKLAIRAEALAPSLVGAVMEVANSMLSNADRAARDGTRFGWQDRLPYAASLLPRLWD